MIRALGIRRTAGVSAAVLLGLCAGCAAPAGQGRSPTAAVVHDVPFVRGGDKDCGPAALAMVLRHHGDPVALETIREAVYSEGARGTLTTDMAWYARQRGFNARVLDGTPEDLRAELDAGRPAILLVDHGLLNIQQDHYLVAVGYDEQSVIVHSGDRAYVHVPEKRLERTWRRNDGWMLLVTE